MKIDKMLNKSKSIEDSDLEEVIGGRYDALSFANIVMNSKGNVNLENQRKEKTNQDRHMSFVGKMVK